MLVSTRWCWSGTRCCGWGLGCSRATMRLHELRHKLGVVLNVFLTHAHLVQLLKQVFPFWINVLHLKESQQGQDKKVNIRTDSKEEKKISKACAYVESLVGIPANVTQMAEVRGESDLSLVQFALGALLLLLAAKESALSRLWCSTWRSTG